MNISDEHLAAGCRKKKAKFQRLLYDRYASTLYGICMRYMKNDFEANDLLQDSFIRIYERIGQYQGVGSLEGWMKRVTVTTILNYITRQKRVITSNDQWEGIEPPSLEASCVDQLTHQELLSLIRALPVGYQTVFNLYEIEGFSHQEIAERLAISESTSKTQLFQARRQLRKRINQYYKI